MKKSKILIMLLFISLFHDEMNAQNFVTVCEENYIPFSTNPNFQSYTTSQIPLNSGNTFKNGIDWNDLTGFDCVDMVFAGIPLNQMTALASTQTCANEFYCYLFTSASGITRKHLHSEGWELLSVNLGTFPDGVT